MLARGGLPAAGALVAFFVTSSALGRYKARAKARRGVLAQAKGGRRDAWQVLANGGAGAGSPWPWAAGGAPRPSSAPWPPPAPTPGPPSWGCWPAGPPAW